METTNLDGVAYPELDDLDQPNVWGATMAQSIEDGIGARLRQQEVAVGLKAGITPGTGIPLQGTTAPFVVLKTNGGFNQGFDLAGGVATVKTKGMYLVTSSVGINPSSRNSSNTGRTVSITLAQGTTELAGSEIKADADYYQNAAATTVISCVPGDTIRVIWRSASDRGATGNAALADSSVLNYLSIALIQAIPT